MQKLSFDEIAKAVGSTSLISGETDIICTDTRKIKKGCLFIALKGLNFDGHDFVREAINQGASAALTSRQVEGCRCIVCDDTKKALMSLAEYYRSKFNPFLVGVTGSVGKTSTKEMIAHVLSSKADTLKTSGNLNNEIGLPLTLFELEDSHKAAVIEMGMSDFGEISRLSKVSKPSCSVVTGIGYSHIEKLGSQKGILKAKLEILDGMSEFAPLIINGDDDLLHPLKKSLKRPVITYGINNTDCDIIAKDIKTDKASVTFTVCSQEKEGSVSLRCIGRHNVLNSLAAFAAGQLFNMAFEEICSALNGYGEVTLRQNISKMGGQLVINDCYNASPESMKAALKVLSQLKPENGGRRVAVLADMLELGSHSERLHSLVGEYAVECGVDILACYGSFSKFTAQRATELGLHAGCTNDRDMLIEYLKMKLKDGDVVLFKGSRGMKLEEVIKRLNDNKA